MNDTEDRVNQDAKTWMEEWGAVDYPLPPVKDAIRIIRALLMMKFPTGAYPKALAEEAVNIVSRLADVYTVDTDQTVLIRLTQEAHQWARTRAVSAKMVNPCVCGHEKGDHQTRIGQRGNYTPCCTTGCKCDGFRRLVLREAAIRVIRAANAVGRPCGSDDVDAALDHMAAVLKNLD